MSLFSRRRPSLETANPAGFRTSLRLLIGISTISVAGRLIGFARDVTLAARFGASREVAAFVIAGGVNAVIAIVLGDALSVAVTRALLTNRAPQASLLRTVTIAGLVVMAAQAALAPMLGPVVSGANSSLAAEVSRALIWTAPGSGGLVVIGGVIGALNGTERLRAAAWLAVAWSAAVFLVLILSPAPQWAIYGGWSIGLGLIAVTSVVIVGGKEVFSATSLSIRPLLIVGPILAASVLNQGSFIVERRVGAPLGPAAVAAIGFSYKIVAVPLSILLGGISAWALPEFVRSLALSLEALKRRLTQILAPTVILMSLAGGAMFVGANAAVEVALRHGRFSTADARLTAGCLRAYSIGLPAMAGYVIAARAAQAIGAYRELILGSAAGLTVTIASVMPLAASNGPFGIALATSIGNWAAFVVVLTLTMSWRYPVNSRSTRDHR